VSVECNCTYICVVIYDNISEVSVYGLNFLTAMG